MKVSLNLLNKESKEYSDLSSTKIYNVLGIEADDYRIVNDFGKPYLYPDSLFYVVDPKRPNEWVTEYGEDGEEYSYPQKLNRIGFFEDYFDGNIQAIETLKVYLSKKG